MEMTEIERRIKAEAHLMLVPQKIRQFSDDSYLPQNRHYVMSSGGITQTLGGRLWIMWAGGGDSWDAHLLFAYSDDNGETFSEPRYILAGPKTPGGLNTCIIEGNLFCDSNGVLHVFYCQRLGFVDGRCGAWHAVCRNPDDASPVWETPERISDGSILDKPIVLQDGRWLLEISIWPKGRLILGPGPEDSQAYSELWEGELDAPRGANIYISSDNGCHWEYQGTCVPNFRECDEPRIIQRKDGSLLMLLRNQKGLAWSESFDLGKNWTSSVPTAFPAPTSRTALLRIPDGRMLLIRNVPRQETIDKMLPDRGWTEGREQLTAFLSDDEGKHWSEGVMIDPRTNVSYPDACITSDGTVHLLYDWQRINGELMYARFTIDDLDNRREIRPRMIFSGH